MRDTRVTAVRDRWQEKYKKKYGMTHYWAAKEQKWAKYLLSFADENFGEESFNRILEAMDNYLASFSQIKHNFATFGAGPQRWFEGKQKAPKPEPVEEKKPWVPCAELSEERVISKLMEDPIHHLKGFRWMHRMMKASNKKTYKNTHLYDMYIQHLPDIIGKDRLKEIPHESDLFS